MSEARSAVATHFDDPAQQREAATLGMWTFLATEVLFFGGLFMAYVVYRISFPGGFAAASSRTDTFYGTLNTAILLTSSLTMAMAVHATQADRRTFAVASMAATVALAVGFLVVKGFEYHEDIQEHLVPGPHFPGSLPPGAAMFFVLYWAMTALHALHVTVGIGAISVVAVRTRQDQYSSVRATPVEMTGLYWHFVDIVWIFLYPLLYLVSRHG